MFEYTLDSKALIGIGVPPSSVAAVIREASWDEGRRVFGSASSPWPAATTIMCVAETLLCGGGGFSRGVFARKMGIVTDKENGNANDSLRTPGAA